jgi:hypothetical protein
MPQAAHQLLEVGQNFEEQYQGQDYGDIEPRQRRLLEAQAEVGSFLAETE